MKPFAEFFKFTHFKTNLKTECFAGLTTFLTMFYIAFVNARMLELAGMDAPSVFVATCLTATIGSLLIGLLANYPIAIAPGMGLNVYFSFVVVQQMGYSWQTALAMTFIAGILLFLLSITKLLPYLLRVIPTPLHLGLATGIGFFMLMIGLENAGLISTQPHFVFLSSAIFSLQTGIFLSGLVLLLVLEYFKCLGGTLISIFFITVMSVFFNLTAFHGVLSLPASLTPTWMALDFHGLLSVNAISVIFVFFLITLFDSMGILMGFLGGSSDPNIPKALSANGLTTISASLLGTSTSCPFIESATGIRAGGKTGLTSIVVAGLFLVALFLSPLTATIPNFAIAPLLIYVGCLMIGAIKNINYKKYSEAVPGLITAIVIPLRFSIADGVGAGLMAYCLIQVLSGKHKEIPLGLWFLVALFLLFYYTEFTMS